MIWVLWRASPGLRVEIAAIVIGVFLLFIFKNPEGVARGCRRGIFICRTLYLNGSSVSLFCDLRRSSAAFCFFYSSTFSAARAIHDFLRPYDEPSPTYAVETVFNLGMAYVLYVLDFSLLVTWFFRLRQQTATELLKSCRPGRMAHYLLMITVGIFVAVGREGGTVFSNGIDVVAFAILLIVYFCAFLFAIGVMTLLTWRSIASQTRRIPSCERRFLRAKFARPASFFWCGRS